MEDHYDFTNAIPNPFASRLKEDITIRMDKDVIAFFQIQANRLGMPLESLINLYLRDCATQERKPLFTWS